MGEPNFFSPERYCNHPSQQMGIRSWGESDRICRRNFLTRGRFRSPAVGEMGKWGVGGLGVGGIGFAFPTCHCATPCPISPIDPPATSVLRAPVLAPAPTQRSAPFRTLEKPQKNAATPFDYLPYFNLRFLPYALPTNFVPIANPQPPTSVLCPPYFALRNLHFVLVALPRRTYSGSPASRREGRQRGAIAAFSLRDFPHWSIHAAAPVMPSPAL